MISRTLTDCPRTPRATKEREPRLHQEVHPVNSTTLYENGSSGRVVGYLLDIGVRRVGAWPYTRIRVHTSPTGTYAFALLGQLGSWAV